MSMASLARRAGDLVFPVSMAAGLAGNLVLNLLAGNWPAAAIEYLCLAVCAVWIAHAARHSRADPGGFLRDGFCQAAKEIGPGEVWLNRDEHLFVTRSRRPYVLSLVVMDEDAVEEVARAGAGPVTGSRFTAVPVIGGVLRHVEGTRVVTDETGGFAAADAVDRKKRGRRLREAVRLAPHAYLSSLMVADADDLRQVIAAVHGAERLATNR